MVTTMSDDHIRIDSDRARIDFKIEVLGEDEDGTLRIAMRPDPARYEWHDEPDGRVLWDTQTNTGFPESVIAEIAAQSAGTPIYAPPSDIPPAPELLASRVPIIKASLRGESDPGGYADPSAQAFAHRVGQELEFVVLSVDLVGSTRLQANNSEAYNLLVPTLAREVSDIGAIFGGLLIKFTGDGAILGFPGPGLNVCADMAFDASTAIQATVRHVLNPLAKDAGLPEILVRIGADANQAKIVNIGSTSNRMAPDVLGLAVSLAAKVEKAGAGGELWVGQTLFENLHISRQQLLSPAPSVDGWDFVNRFDHEYQLYRMAC